MLEAFALHPLASERLHQSHGTQHLGQAGRQLALARALPSGCVTHAVKQHEQHRKQYRKGEHDNERELWLDHVHHGAHADHGQGVRYEG